MREKERREKRVTGQSFAFVCHILREDTYRATHPMREQHDKFKRKRERDWDLDWKRGGPFSLFFCEKPCLHNFFFVVKRGRKK